MEAIVPCRGSISDRFPIASFTIRSSRPCLFEVVCATDPRLLHTDNAARRTSSNFYTSRADGLLSAAQGETTWIVPPHALRRFAGARRLYYALGTYGSRNGDAASFTVAPDTVEQTPSIAIAADFTGRSVDRRRIGAKEPVTAAYGGQSTGVLRWGGDAALEAERRSHSVTDSACGRVYDDGYDVSLWGGQDGADVFDPDYADDLSVPEDPAVDSSEAGGEPALSVASGGCSSCSCPSGERGRRLGSSADPASELEEYEDGADYYRRSGGDSAHGYAVARGAAAEDGDGEDYEDGADYYRRSPEAASESAGLTQPARVIGRAQSAPQRTSLRYGRREIGASAPGTGRGRHPDFQEEDREESLPVGPAAHALSAAYPGGAALEIPEKVRILRIVARAESGSDGYAAVAVDPEYEDPTHPAYHNYHFGLSWGLILFPQRTGALGRVLRAARAREEQSRTPPANDALPAERRLSALLGPAWETVLSVTDPDITTDPEGRVAPVEGTVLWEEPWLSRFRSVGHAAHVQAAQNEVAVVGAFDPILPLARGLGLSTDRGLALLVDRLVHMGIGAGRSWIMHAIGPIRSEADRDAALAALGHARGDLRSFQAASGLVADGKWCPVTHAALAGALRQLGPASPIVIPPAADLQAALLQAARSTPFAERMQALLDNRSELAEAVSFDLS